MRAVAIAVVALAACATSPRPSPAPAGAPPPDVPAAPSAIERGLAEVAAVHGGAGPFAVAGYRIGQRALVMLDLPEGAFQLEVIHESPRQVQWSCMADGAQAATGVSVGKLNLSLVETDQAHVRTRIRDRKTGRTLTFTLTETFIARFLGTPYPELRAAGEAVMALPDEAIFAVTGP